MFAATWSAVALLTFTVVAMVAIASFTARIDYAVMWPPFVLAMYGGSWLVMGILLNRRWSLLAAFSCCATSILMGFNPPELVVCPNSATKLL